MARCDALRIYIAVKTHAHLMVMSAYLLYWQQHFAPLLADERENGEDSSNRKELKDRAENIRGKECSNHGQRLVGEIHSAQCRGKPACRLSWW